MKRTKFYSIQNASKNFFFGVKLFVGLFFFVFIFSSTTKGQSVGINATGAAPSSSAMLDVSSSNSGLLLPRVALQSTTDVTTIASPTTSLIVYNTNSSMTGGSVGFFYWDGSQWQLFYTTANTQWVLTGNVNTVPGTNFLGTIDSKDLVFKTTSVERIRILAAGMVGINIAPSNSEMLTVAGGTINGINATTTSTSSTGYALHAVDTTGDEVFLGYTGTITVAGNPYKKPVIYSNSTFTAGSGGTPALLALSSGTSNASSIVAYSTVSCGVLSYSTLQTNGAGVWGQNTNSGGTGVIGVGNNLGNATYAPGGSGGAFKGDSVGAFGYSTKGHGYGAYGQASGTSGTGVVGVGNNVTPAVLAGGSGGAFFGSVMGLYAASTTSTNPSGSFQGYNTQTGSTEYLNYYNGTNYKILQAAAGSVSCAVKDLNGNYVVMHAPETPEIYFQDYGQGKLVNGFTHIDLDPILAKNVAINSKHPLRVFIQLEDNENCKGVVVKNKTINGFDVMELNGGSSNTPFQYQVICNVADAEMPSGVISKFEDLRFEPAPETPKVIKHPDQKFIESDGIPR